MKKLNILYWNIHYADGISTRNRQLDDSSTVIIDTINEIVKEKKGTEDEINTIVFSEAYPQFDSSINNTNRSSSAKIYNYFKNENNYFVYPYDTEKYSNMQRYPFKEKGEFTNGILIATKEKFNIVECNPSYPNILKLENDKYSISGIRMISKYDYFQQAKKIKEFLNNSKKNIIIGDFNNGAIKENDFIKCFSGINIYKNCEFGTMVALMKENENSGKFCINNPDRLLFQNCNPKKFESIRTPEQVLCSSECLDNNKYSGNEINARFGRLNDNVCKIIVKTCQGQKRTQNLALADIDYDKVVFKDKYKNYGARVIYNRTNVCTAPFPDHNLLFASIDLGDE